MTYPVTCSHCRKVCRSDDLICDACGHQPIPPVEECQCYRCITLRIVRRNAAQGKPVSAVIHRPGQPPAEA